MSLVNPYCSLAQLQEELRNSDAALNATFEGAINEASRWIDEYKGRDYYKHDHTVTPLVVRLPDQWIYGDSLFLPWPIISLTGVSVTIGGIAETWTENTDYIQHAGKSGLDNRIITLRTEWPLVTPADKVSLTGTFGYAQASASAVPSLPAHINRAAILIAAAFSGRNQKEVVGLDGQKQEVLDKHIPKQVYSILGGRVPRV